MVRPQAMQSLSPSIMENGGFGGEGNDRVDESGNPFAKFEFDERKPTTTEPVTPSSKSKLAELEVDPSASVDSDSSPNRNGSSSSLAIKKKRKVLIDSSDDDDDEGETKTNVKRALVDVSLDTPSPVPAPSRKRKAILDSDDDDEHEDEEREKDKGSSRKQLKMDLSKALDVSINEVSSGSDSDSSNDDDDDENRNDGENGRVLKKKRLLKKKKLKKGGADNKSVNSNDKKKVSRSSKKKNAIEINDEDDGDLNILDDDGDEHDFVDKEAGRDVVGELFEKVRTISSNLSARLSKFDSLSGGDIVSRECADKLTPPGLSLKDYQLAGLNWLTVLYKEGLNCILADEMGLGKTIQTMTFLSWLRQIKDIPGPHLVVAPASTLENWRRELATWLPSHKTVVYHGSQSVRRDLRNEYRPRKFSGCPFDIVLTTYTYFERESCGSDRKYFESFKFQFSVFDEAHNIKSMNTSRYQRLGRLSTKRRLLLTGTPIQNNLQEVLALMSFCLPNVFDADSEQLNEYFSDENNATKTDLASLLKPFVLRRLKSMVLNQLVPKVEHVELIPLEGRQNKVYKEIIDTYRNADRNASGDNRLHFFSELRKAANHPLLVRYHFGRTAEQSEDGVDRSLPKITELLHRYGAYGKEATVEMIEKEIRTYSDWQFNMMAVEYGNRSRELAQMQLPSETLWTSGKCQKLKGLLPKLVENGNRFLIFSQWTTILDLLEEVLNTLNVKFLRFDGQTNVSDRQGIIDVFNSDRSISAMLLSTRAGGMGINLTSADTVILHDLDFNPSIDRQAEDRVHRIGQTKQVNIYKLVTQETVDENILLMQQRKKKLDETLMNQSQNSAHIIDTSTDDVDPVKLIMDKLLKNKTQ